MTIHKPFGRKKEKVSGINGIEFEYFKLSVAACHLPYIPFMGNTEEEFKGNPSETEL